MNAIETANASDERIAMLQTIREIAYMLALVGSSVAFALTAHESLAATAIGGALGLALPRVSPARVPPIAMGLLLGAVVTLSGCTGAQAVAGAELSCDITRKLCQVANGVCAVTSGSEITSTGAGQ